MATTRTQPVGRLFHHVHVLHVERLVEAPGLADVLDVLVVGGPARDAHRRISAGNDDEDQEDEEADDQQHEHHSEQASDREREHQCSILTFARGSSASRRPSPKMFSERTVRTIARPGTTVSHGAVVRRVWPSEMSVPHDGFGGCTPAPRNDSAASVRMLLAMMSVKKTRTVDAMLGRISANMTRKGFAPCEIDASMNSFSRSERICPRSGRPTYGIRTYAITSVGIQRLPVSMLIGPQWRPLIESAAPSAIARRITGKAQRRSKNREISQSPQPP